MATKDLSSTQLAFVEWFCDPRPRDDKGSQQQFATQYGETTERLRRWKKQEWFKSLTEERLREEALGEESTWELIRAAKEKALQGDVQAMKVVLAYQQRLNPMRQIADDGDLKGKTSEELLAMLAGAIE